MNFLLPKRTKFKEDQKEKPTVLIVDASESKIQRPKNKKSIIQERKNATQENFK